MKMTMFRRYAALAGAVALCSASLYTVPMMAQGGGGGGMRMTPDQRLAAIDKAVTLTDDQKPKVKAILDADAKKMQDLMANQDPDMRTKMMAIRTDEQTQIKVLLTDDQKTKYDAYIASTSNRRGGGAPAGAPADTPPPAPPQ